MLTPASAATSSRRRPGVRRRPLSTRPTSAGCNASRRARRNTPRSVESLTGPVCRTAPVRSWPQHSQDASSRITAPRNDPAFLAGARRAHDRPMTTTNDLTTLPLAAGRWAVDLAHSSVGFSVRHLGVSKVRGRFNRFDVDVVIGADARGHVGDRDHRRRVDRHRQRRPRRARAQPPTSSTSRVARRSCSARRASPTPATTTTVDGDLTIGDDHRAGHARGRVRRRSRSSPAGRVTPASKRRRRSSGRTSASTSRCRRA